MTTFIDDLTDAIDIPADGTLSRVLAKRGPVRLVAFGFDVGQELTEHSAAVPVIIQVLTGSVTVGADGEQHHMSPASWMYLEAGVPHTVVAHEPARLLLTLIRPA